MNGRRAASLAALILATLLQAWGALPVCPTDEGGPNVCRWDAGTAGNGRGESFVSLPGGWIIYDSGTVTRD